MVVTRAVEKKETAVAVKTPKYNKSLYFLFPLMDITGRNRNIINSYLEIITIDNLDTKKKEEDTSKKELYLNIYKPDEDLLKNKYFSDERRLTDGTFLYTFSLPDEFHKEYDLFIQGKYSEFSDKAKIILSTHSTNSKLNIKESRMFKILNKDPEIIKDLEEKIGQKLPKDAECYSIVNMEDEILYYNCFEGEELV